MKKTIVEAGQNLRDLAIQCYGSIEYLFDLVRDNGLESLTPILTDGQEIQYRELEEDIYYGRVQRFYELRKLRVKTGEVPYDNGNLCDIPEGFGRFKIRFSQPPKGRRHIVLYFSTDPTCRPASDMNGIWETMEEAQPYFAFLNQTYQTSAEAAQIFAEWWNMYQTGIAVPFGDEVTLHLPIGEQWLCGKPLTFCPYEMGDNLYFTELRDIRVIDYIDSAIQCC